MCVNTDPEHKMIYVITESILQQRIYSKRGILLAQNAWVEHSKG